VAGNPWDGSALLWALDDRKTVFVHLDIATTADQDYLAAHLIDAATDPKVCAAGERLNVGYLVIGEPVLADLTGDQELPRLRRPRVPARLPVARRRGPAQALPAHGLRAMSTNSL
jgi:hypothetical protein